MDQHPLQTQQNLLRRSRTKVADLSTQGDAIAQTLEAIWIEYMLAQNKGGVRAATWSRELDGEVGLVIVFAHLNQSALRIEL
ncbi:MAG: hypothetical protein ABS96_28865 [Lysobacteraceae bacterium SCN 69-123]|nr:MAG: hypothetical protein ABS96_28865 [Xanthomonadaceae bacterium SCN 69-123]